MHRIITAALPYVNNVPHLGNLIGSTLSADVFARYCRLQGDEVLFVCGTDEFGTATEVKARAAGCTPQEICDEFHAKHRAIYEWFGVSFDIFGRTTTPEQTEVAQSIYNQLSASGALEDRQVDQFYCNGCEQMLCDRFVQGICEECGSRSKGDQCDCGNVHADCSLLDASCVQCDESGPRLGDSHVTIVQSTHRYLLLSQVHTLPDFAAHISCTVNAAAITKAALADIADRPITRDLTWGTKVPDMDGKVFYVWFDAPIGYMSITKAAREDYADWWQPVAGRPRPELVQFMGKDNVYFHSVMFPGTLLAAGPPHPDRDWNLVSRISATEYLTYEGDKFSKSGGTGIFCDTAIKTGIPCYLWRFYLLEMRPEKSDTDFDWDAFRRSADNLSGCIGNLFYRSLSLAAKKMPGEFVIGGDIVDHGLMFTTAVQEISTKYHEDMRALELRAGLRGVLVLAKLCNRFINETKPWKEVGIVSLITVLNVLPHIAAMLSPFAPELAARMCEQLNCDMPQGEQMEFVILPHHVFGEFDRLVTVDFDPAEMRARVAGQYE